MAKTKLQKDKVLIVDDEPEIIKILDKTLSRKGFAVSKASDGYGALDKVKKENPDIILLDISMPRMDGLEVKSRLNQETSTASIPVIFITGKTSVSHREKGFNLCIDDYIFKPFDLNDLVLRVKGALNRRRFYDQISTVDSLTGLFNKNYFIKQFGLFFSISKRYKSTFSLAIVDVDDFKSINDTHGHAAGDFVLRKLSCVLKDTLRRSDIISRYGGDEFAVIFPESNLPQALRAMQRVDEQIKNKEFEFKDLDKKITFSISAGAATYDERFKNETELFALADKRMYQQKKKRAKYVQNK